MSSKLVNRILDEWVKSDQTILSLHRHQLDTAGWVELQAQSDAFKAVKWLGLREPAEPCIEAANAFCRCLPNLTRLSYWDAQDSTLGRLIEGIDLKWINLHECRLATDECVRAVVARRPALTHLYLSSCGLVTDEGLRAIAAGLPALTYLDLYNCKLVTDEGLRALAAGLPALTHLDLSRTAVGLSAELIGSRDAQAIFRAVLGEAAKPLREAKLLLLGNGEVGKSHLKDRLCGDELAFDDHKDRTHDIDFALWPETAARPRTRLWDFGGQPFLHGSHRFFLGADYAAYVLVLDATRTAADNHLNYWLRFIAHHGKSARAGANAPVVIVLNKCDVFALAEGEHFRTRWAEAAAVRARNADLLAGLAAAELKGWHGANVIEKPIDGLGCFTNKRAKYDADRWLKTLPGTDPVPDGVYDAILRRHNAALAEVNAAVTAALAAVPKPSLGHSAAFHDLKAYLEAEFVDGVPAVTETPWLDGGTAAWRDKVFGELKVREDDLDICLQTLRSLGILHWVGDFDAVGRGEHPVIRERVFNPHWVKGPVYRLIRLSQGEHDRGRVERRTIDARLGDYPPEQRAAALDLMLACKVAFRLRDRKTDEYTTDRLVPDLLEPIGADADPVPAEKTARRLGVPFLSDRVLLRFIGERYTCVDKPKKNCWRDLVEFPWPTRRACVVRVSSALETGAAELPSLRIEVSGGTPADRAFVADSVTDELTQILRSEKLLDGDEEPVIVPDPPTVPVPAPRPSPQDWLRQYLNDNRQGPWQDVDAVILEHFKITDADEPAARRKTLANYRQPKHAGVIVLADGDGGRDKGGRIWRKPGQTVEYLTASLTRPVPHPDSAP